MKLKYFFIVLLFIVNALYPIRSSAYRDYYAVGSVHPVSGDNSRVRRAPDMEKGEIVDTLSAGSYVTISGKTEKSMKVNGYSEYWYRVKYKRNSKDYEGYIWGGLLSITYISMGDRLFLTGIKKYNEENGYTAECRLVVGGRIISSVEFQPHYLPDGSDNGFYQYSSTIEVKGSSALDGIENIIKINFNYGACGYPYGDIWLGYGNGKLYFIGKNSSVAEGGVFHSDEKFIFPDQKKGIRNRVVLIRENSDFDEKTNGYRLTERRESVFLWRDFRLVPVR